MTSRRLDLVVAACRNGGIGINGQLPWRLKGDMAFFKRITLKTSNPDLQNAVIMGRKTWDSIPTKFRPLTGRINIIISRNLKDAPEGAHLANSLEGAMKLCDSENLSSKLEQVFIIGGNSIYELVMQSNYPLRVYFTRVDADFKCDTFFPAMEPSVFKQITADDVEKEEQEENGIKYQYEVYDRN